MTSNSFSDTLHILTTPHTLIKLYWLPRYLYTHTSRRSTGTSIENLWNVFLSMGGLKKEEKTWIMRAFNLSNISSTFHENNSMFKQATWNIRLSFFNFQLTGPAPEGDYMYLCHRLTLSCRLTLSYRLTLSWQVWPSLGGLCLCTLSRSHCILSLQTRPSASSAMPATTPSVPFHWSLWTPTMFRESNVCF